MTGAWLLANDLKQMSDCTGGRIDDAVRYCQSERINNAEACNAISKADFKSKRPNLGSGLIWLR